MSSKNPVIDLRAISVRRADTPHLPLHPKPPRKKSREPLRARRRRHRFIALLAFFPIAVSAAWGISWASYLPRFNVDRVEVAGASAVPAKLIELYAETKLHPATHPFLSSTNVLDFNAKSLAQSITGFFPRIQTVTVTRSSMMATAATIVVVERQPYALWCTAQADASTTAPGSCYEMDDTGVLFAGASASSSELATPYVFEGDLAVASTSNSRVDSTGADSLIGSRFASGHIAGMVSFLDLLDQNNFTPQMIAVQDSQDFTVTLAQGFYLKVSFGEDPATLVRNLQLVLSSDALSGKQSQLEYVDLRFGDRVYYKLQGKSQASAG